MAPLPPAYELDLTATTTANTLTCTYQIFNSIRQELLAHSRSDPRTLTRRQKLRDRIWQQKAKGTKNDGAERARFIKREGQRDKFMRRAHIYIN